MPIIVGILIVVAIVSHVLGIGFWWAALICVGIIVAFFALLLIAAHNGPEDENENQPTKNKKTGRIFSVNAKLKINYVDAEGEMSEREIHAYEYDDSSPGHIYARCMKARRKRTFRTDRIRQAIDLETGEIIKRVPTFMRSKRVD